MFDRIRQYRAERNKWIAAGRPMRTPEQIAAIHKVCSECPLFNPGGGLVPGFDQCSKCGCNLHPTDTTMNKIAWATTSCPDEPPKWSPDAIGTPESDSK